MTAADRPGAAGEFSLADITHALHSLIPHGDGVPACAALITDNNQTVSLNVILTRARRLVGEQWEAANRAALIGELERSRRADGIPREQITVAGGERLWRPVAAAASPAAAQDEISEMLDHIHFVMPNLNDTFHYACADTEQIEAGEGPVMAAWWRRHRWHGLVALAAWRRGRHPLPEITADARYRAAVADLASDEQVSCPGEPDTERWLWWFDLDDLPALEPLP